MNCNHEWKFQIDEDFTSWIRCKKCNENMFGKDIGVILINWKKTDIDAVYLEELLIEQKTFGR